MTAPLVEPPAATPAPGYGSYPTDALPPANSVAPTSATPAPTPQIAQPSASAPADAGSPAAYSYASQSTGVADSTAAPLNQAAFGPGGFGLERHAPQSRSNNTPLDIAAVILAIVLPPIGLITAIVALVVGARSRGFATGLAKAALAIGIVFSIGTGVGVAVLAKMNSDQAAHNAIVASSQAWCTKLQANPATLKSDTFGWPAPADTIPASIKAMKEYVDFWNSLAKIAPSGTAGVTQGIKGGTQDIADAAKSIETSVSKTQTLDDASNVSEMQQATSSSGVSNWVTEYCK